MSLARAASGGFACAGALRMRLNRTRAMFEAAEFGRLRAGQAAATLAHTLDSYAAIACAFEAATTSAETSAALAAAGGRSQVEIPRAAERALAELRLPAIG